MFFKCFLQTPQYLKEQRDITSGGSLSEYFTLHAVMQLEYNNPGLSFGPKSFLRLLFGFDLDIYEKR